MSKTTKLPDGIEAFIRQNRKICWDAELEGGNFCIGEDKVRDFFERFIVPELKAPESKDELVREKDRLIVELVAWLRHAVMTDCDEEERAQIDALISKASGQSNGFGKEANSAHSFTEGGDI